MQPHVEFIKTPRGSLSRAAAAAAAVKKTDGGMFWWTIAIIVLMALAAFSWVSCIYIFTHPEKPFNYKLLSRIHRLPEIKAFAEENVPSGKSLSPPELYQKFYPFSEDNLANHNDLLRRNYITNFKNRDEKPTYVRGRFRVVMARPLAAGDVFPSGVVARAVAINDDGKEFRNVVVEYVLPTVQARTGVDFAPGDVLDIDSRRSKKRLYGSVVNIHRVNEDVLVFTVVPLLYGEHQIDAAKNRVLRASPPEFLDFAARFPLTDAGAGSSEIDARLPGVAAAGR